MFPSKFPTATEHDYPDSKNEKGYYVCTICNHAVKIIREGTCLGVPIYKKWDDIPDGIATKTTLYKEHGLKLAVDQLPVGAKVQYNGRGKKTGGYYPLYTIEDATPKKKATPEQLEALEKARYMAEKRVVVCSSCGNPESTKYDWLKITRKQWIDDNYDEYLCDHCKDTQNATATAKQWLANHNAVILDTETSGLDNAEIIEIAIIDTNGNTLLDTRIKPHHPEKVLEPTNGRSAYDIHGIHPDDLADKPTLKDMYEKLKQLLTGKLVLVYNKAFDIPLLNSLIAREGLELIQFDSDCVMETYAVYVGDYSEYWGSYKWQPLRGGDHSALGDCKATLEVIREMANSEVVTDE